MADGHGPLAGKSSYELTRFNALRHGILSKHAVLPWEDRREYDQLLEALIAEHKPQGPTEEHLVEELAINMWCKARLRLAEKAAHFRALQRTTEVGEYGKTSRAALVLVSTEFQGRARGEAITSSDAQRTATLDTLQIGETKALSALKILKENKTQKAYSAAMNELNKEDLGLWNVKLSSNFFTLADGEATYLNNPEDFERFIETEVLSKYRDRRIESALNNG